MLKVGLNEVDQRQHERICAYLATGATWFLLKTLAVTAREEGGLGLFVQGSATYTRIFSNQPGTVLRDRPESVKLFLEFLRGREGTLARLAAIDVARRHLKDDAQEAACSLADVDQRVKRSILGELLHRGLHLAKISSTVSHIARERSLEDLWQAGAAILLDASCKTSVLRRLGAPANAMVLWSPRTWVEVAVRLEYPDEAEAWRRMDMFMSFYRRVAEAMESHLKLTGENIVRTPWLAAQLLSKDAVKATAAARELMRHLATIAPSRKTKFETVLFEDMELMAQMGDFASQADPPCCLWKRNGRWHRLYIFVASRFLANPDNVMDVERLHAVWKWVLLRKRSLKLKSLNAWLKLGAYLRSNGALPSPEDLGRHVEDVKAGFARALAEVRNANEIAPGSRLDSLWWPRLNLSVADCALLRGAEQPAQTTPAPTYHQVWANHVRWTLVPGTFQSFPSLRPGLFVHITENKSLPGREGRADGEAVGRAVACTWFEVFEDRGDEGIEVQRVDRSSDCLVTQLSTIAELLHAAGEPYARLGSDASSLQIEVAMEALYATRVRLVWESQQQWFQEDPWRFVLSNPQPAEDAFLYGQPLETHNKMALARILELQKGQDRKIAWTRLNKPQLLAAIAAP